ncbi:MAG: ABC transporter permease, partial [Armatimonadetes bacterium]|nr:ABC transporter permease [Armatimonadota bacterium]
MLRLVVQRLLFTVLVLLGATAIVFFLSHVIPSDPAIA